MAKTKLNKTKINPAKWKDTTTKEQRMSTEERLKGEIDTYDQYISGDFYSFTVTNPSTGKSGSVGGYYGMADAKENAELYIKEEM